MSVDQTSKKFVNIRPLPGCESGSTGLGGGVWGGGRGGLRNRFVTAEVYRLTTGFTVKRGCTGERVHNFTHVRVHMYVLTSVIYDFT
jgi:hypothetical protein